MKDTNNHNNGCEKMTEKRFWSEDYSVRYYTEIVDNEKELKDVPNPKKNLTIEEVVDTLNELHEENKELKKENEELLYQIGEVGKNNKTCRECECFIPKIKYCYMWDMEVEADDVVVACDQRKVKKYK